MENPALMPPFRSPVLKSIGASVIRRSYSLYAENL
jgi:hypothetical protein